MVARFDGRGLWIRREAVPQERSFPTNCWEQRDGTPSQYTAQGHCYPSPAHPRNFRFSCHPFFPVPCRCRRRAPREPTSPMNKTRRIQWKPVSTRDRRFVFFFLHLLLIYDVCYVLTTDEACNRETRGTDVVRCKLRNPKAYSSLSKTELRSEQLLVAKLQIVAHTFQTAWVSHNSNSWCLQTMKLIFKNGHVSVHLVPILKTKEGIL